MKSKYKTTVTIKVDILHNKKLNIKNSKETIQHSFRIFCDGLISDTDGFNQDVTDQLESIEHHFNQVVT